MPRLRRTSPDQPGWTRRRVGKGFTYLDEHGERLGAEEVQRCKDLVIPPAWRDVWITPHPHGHLQAVGTDDAGGALLDRCTKSASTRMRRGGSLSVPRIRPTARSTECRASMSIGWRITVRGGDTSSVHGLSSNTTRLRSP